MRYWLSFDLGLRGKYEELYVWLDNMAANECGNNVATFSTKKTAVQIRKELFDLLGEDARVYLINMHHGGTFIIGKRKRSPWVGYGGAVLGTKIEK